MTFKSQDGSIEVDFKKMEAYFTRDDLVARMRKDEFGYCLFEHPMWLTAYRVFVGSKPFQLERQTWRIES